MRYTVEYAPDMKVWWIKDNNAEQYNMPVKCVSLYFAEKSRPTLICLELNLEWKAFVERPS